jgi:hypothetical protein
VTLAPAFLFDWCVDLLAPQIVQSFTTNVRRMEDMVKAERSHHRSSLLKKLQLRKQRHTNATVRGNASPSLEASSSIGGGGSGSGDGDGDEDDVKHDRADSSANNNVAVVQRGQPRQRRPSTAVVESKLAGASKGPSVWVALASDTVSKAVAVVRPAVVPLQQR